MIAPAPARTGDAVAIGLSGLCLIHCLALPVLVGVMPLVGAWAEAEWVHLALVSLAVPVSIWTLSRPPRDTLPWAAAVLAAIGFVCLIFGALGYPREALETPLTVAGGLALAAAHIFNWRRRPPPCSSPAQRTGARNRLSGSPS